MWVTESSHERVRASVLYPLDNGFAAVVDREVDGAGSLPERMEANPSRRISQARAATRAARGVFLSSAPLSGQPNAGITGPGLRLACAEPGEQIAVFGEALRELAERATYLYEEAGRYWFSTQPTLNRLADERATALPDHEVDAAIADILRREGASKGSFARVHAAPDDPTSIDEATAMSLVILGPGYSHAGKGAGPSTATEAASEALLRCRSAQRRFRNTLIFVAADEAGLATVREVVYGKAKSDGVILERLGRESLWLALSPIWPTDRAHLPIAEVEEWFASYVYLPKVRDRVVLQMAIGDAVSQLDPKFGFAEARAP